MLRLEFCRADIFSKSVGWADFFPLAQLFAANAVSGPILAMYMVSLDSNPSSYDHLMAFESEQRIRNAVEPACGA